MSGIRDYIWLLPFIGSILAVISIFTPAAVNYSGPGTFLHYMTGLYVIIGGGSPSFGFVDIPIIIIVGIICLILMLVSTIITFISSLTHRKSAAPASWIVLGILFIGAATYYIVGTGTGYMFYYLINFDSTVNYWETFSPSFGAIAPFISGGLSITAYIVSKYTGKEQVGVTPITKDTTPVSTSYTPVSKEEAPVIEPISQPTPIVEPESIKFCPACGEKIPSAGAQFCPGCGTDLKT